MAGPLGGPSGLENSGYLCTNDYSSMTREHVSTPRLW